MKSNGFAQSQKILVVGGGGYVGAVLVPKLLNAGYHVRVLDLFIYGEQVFDGVQDRSRLEIVKADVRDLKSVEAAVAGCQSLIHLACISNDPSFELDPKLGEAVNYTAFEPLVKAAREAGVKRFIYASSSSVYGISDEPDVGEEHALRPLTDYSKYKVLCEKALLPYQDPEFTTVIIRPATVCGYSPRLRLDLTVNILTSLAVNQGRLTVYGGRQKRPNIHIADITDLYVRLLEIPAEKIAGKIFNAGYQNHTVSEIAEIVRAVVEKKIPSRAPIKVVTVHSDDQRSYHISSEKIRRELSFVPCRSIEDAVAELAAAFQDGRITNPEDVRYFNIKTMQAAGMK